MRYEGLLKKYNNVQTGIVERMSSDLCFIELSNEV